MRVSLHTNVQPIVAGDDITIAIHVDTWEAFSTVYYTIETVAPAKTIASFVSPFNLEYDWTVDVVGVAVVFKVTAFPIVHSAMTSPVTIFPAAAKIIAPADNEQLHAGSPYTFRWKQTPPVPPSYRLRFSTDGAQTFPELGGVFSGGVDSVTRNVPTPPTDQGRVRLEGLFTGFAPVFNPPIEVRTTDKTILHVIQPNPPTRWPIGEDATISWDAAGDVDHFSVALSRDGGHQWTTLASTVAGTERRLTIAVSPPASANCRVKVEAFGAAGSTIAEGGVFHIAGAPPRRDGHGPRD